MIRLAPRQCVSATVQVVLVVMICWLTGCVSPATSTGMVPTVYEGSGHHAGSVRVQVTGGCDGCKDSRGDISDTAFAEALTSAISKSGVFSSVASGNGGDYVLSVRILNIQSPVGGMAMTASMEAGWTLTTASDNKVVWREAIDSSYRAAWGEAFLGDTRVRLAWEGVGRQNITQGIAKLSGVTLPNR